MYDRFLPAAVHALNRAVREAENGGSGVVAPEHLLLGLMYDLDSIAGRTLHAFQPSPQQARFVVGSSYGQNLLMPPVLAPATREVIRRVLRNKRGAPVSAEDLLLAVLEVALPITIMQVTRATADQLRDAVYALSFSPFERDQLTEQAERRIREAFRE